MANLASGNMQMQEGLGNISVEDSKFLGGDLKHTHLVKGLDYALLQKVCCHPILHPAIRCFNTCCYPQSATEDLPKHQCLRAASAGERRVAGEKG